ncbi:MAG: GNAT family N-acetyltransferase [Candidatus Pacearchaeota archaeon]
MEIRKATLKDLKDILALSIQEERYFKRKEKEDIYAMKDKKSIAQLIKEKLTNKDKIIFIAVKDSKTIGFLFGGIWKTPAYEIAKKGVLDDVFVIKEHRNQGIGTKLIKMFFEWLKEKNVKYCLLYVSRNNKEGLKLYQKLGFEINYFEMLKKLK